MHKKIFVVEDESIVLMEIRSRLETLGYEVAGTASRAEEAVDKILQCEPDLILMDIRLKGEMTGLEAARMLKEKINSPIIFLTAYADEDSLKRAKEINPDFYLLKPFGDEEFEKSILQALDKAGENK